MVEASSDRRHASRVALGLLVPGLALVVSGHPALILYAVFGSFAGMYGRGEASWARLRHQFHGAGMLVTGVAIGSALAHTQASTAVLIATETTFATLGSLLTDRLRLRPGGPFFGIFALGATATVGPSLCSWSTAVAITAATAGLGMLLSVLADRLRGRSGTEASDGPAAREPAPSRAGASVLHALRYAVATGLAGAVGRALGLEHANWAMASAAVPLAAVGSGRSLALRAVVDRAVHRVAGTLAGLVLTAALLKPHPDPTALALIVMALLFPTELFMSRHYGVALGFFTPLIMIMTDLARPADPATMLLDRGLDTVIGVAAAIGAAAIIGRAGRRTHEESGALGFR